jgi:hypothetical protein
MKEPEESLSYGRVMGRDRGARLKSLKSYRDAVDSWEESSLYMAFIGLVREREQVSIIESVEETSVGKVGIVLILSLSDERHLNSMWYFEKVDQKIWTLDTFPLSKELWKRCT